MVTDSMELDPILWGSLGDDLLEKIVARLTLKALVRSQILAKKWRLLFHSPPFQAEVSRLAYTGWSSYFPLTLTLSSKYARSRLWVLNGLDPISYTWEGLHHFPLYEWGPHLQYGFTRGFSSVLGNLFAFYNPRHGDLPLEIVLTNPVSQPNVIRTLPPLHFTGHGILITFDKSRNKLLIPSLNVNFDCPPVSVTLLPDGYFSYKVLALSRHPHIRPWYDPGQFSYLLARVYHPKLDSWTECRNVPAFPQGGFTLESSAHLERVCYLHFLRGEALEESFCVQSLRSYLDNSMILCAYGIDDDSFTKIVLPNQRQHPEVYIGDCQVVVCGNDLLFVFWLAPESLYEALAEAEYWERLAVMAYHPSYPLWRKSFMVSKLDLETLQLTPVARSPIELLESFGSITTGVVFGDSGHVYFQMRTTLVTGKDRPNLFPRAHRYRKPDPKLVLETVLVLKPGEREEKQWTIFADTDHLWGEHDRESNAIMLQPGIHPFIKV